MEQLQNGVSWLLLPTNAEFPCADKNIYIGAHSFIHCFIQQTGKEYPDCSRHWGKQYTSPTKFSLTNQMELHLLEETGSKYDDKVNMYKTKHRVDGDKLRGKSSSREKCVGGGKEEKEDVEQIP